MNGLPNAQVHSLHDNHAIVFAFVVRLLDLMVPDLMFECVVAPHACFESMCGQLFDLLSLIRSHGH